MSHIGAGGRGWCATVAKPCRADRMSDRDLYRQRDWGFGQKIDVLGHFVGTYIWRIDVVCLSLGPFDLYHGDLANLADIVNSSELGKCIKARSTPHEMSRKDVPLGSESANQISTISISPLPPALTTKRPQSSSQATLPSSSATRTYRHPLKWYVRTASSSSLTHG